jgi:hypothetical protein
MYAIGSAQPSGARGTHGAAKRRKAFGTEAQARTDLLAADAGVSRPALEEASLDRRWHVRVKHIDADRSKITIPLPGRRRKLRDVCAKKRASPSLLRPFAGVRL